MINQLQQLGLSEKESKVYLSALELGSSSVQDIALKAGINRPTAYFQIELLMNKGLISSVTKGKKRYFNAESPEQLMRLLDVQEKEIKNKRNDFQNFLPELKTIFDLVEEKPKVRFFEGIEGLKTIQKDILKTETKTLEEFIPLDDTYKVFPPNPKDHRKEMAKKLKNISVKVIYTSKKGNILSSKDGNRERRFIPLDKFPFHAEINIYNNKVAIASERGKSIGVIIESKDIADALKSIFNLAWEGAKKYQK